MGTPTQDTQYVQEVVFESSMAAVTGTDNYGLFIRLRTAAGTCQMSLILPSQSRQSCQRSA